jgi:glycosyltransferase involved in cell wall biosynthesis
LLSWLAAGAYDSTSFLRLTAANPPSSLSHDLFVSCIMPTRNRPQFVRQAIRSFYRQHWTASELVVVDDGELSARALCDGLPRVRYVRLDRPTPTGTKLNIGIEQSIGSIVQKFDDDDYYGAAFLTTAVAALIAAPEDALVAWDCFLVLIAGDMQPRFSGHGWTAGGTLCFRRAVWEARPFQAEWKGSDSAFVDDHDTHLTALCAPEQYVLVRHGANTWTEVGPYRTDDYLGALPIYERPIERMVDRAALRFYEALPPVRCSE